MSQEEVIVGIDLGTTNSLVGVVESGFPIILADENGKRLCPSVVHYAESGKITVGEEARRQQILQPDRTVSSVKRLIGQTADSLPKSGHGDHSSPVEADDHGRLSLQLAGGLTQNPAEVSSQILKHLKKVAEDALETEVNRAVITVPAYFNNRQREETRKAGEMAGFTVERIINEPTAAALAYGLENLDEAETVAVYDLGGGTFDLSVLKMQEGLFEVIATAGDTRLGGDDIDLELANFLLLKMEISGDSVNRANSPALLALAREAKEALSREESFEVRLPFFAEGKSYETTVTREELDGVIGPIIEKTRNLCVRAFAEAENKGVSEIDHLILVGGSTRIPLVRELLEKWFGLEPNLSQHPDEAIALGAAVQAGILCGRIRQVVLLDVTPLSLGIETFGGLMNIIIPRNSTIPAKAGELFTNAVANQKSTVIRVLQGEREMARDNWNLGEIEVPFQPGQKGSARVGVQFAIDQNGILEVLTRDTATGEDHILEIRDSAVDVEDTEVEKMVSESIDYAFDDMNERIWTEATMKSRELLPAVETALEQVGELLAAEETKSISDAAERVRQLLENSEEKDAVRLKKANAELDEATQTLAATLVDLAFSQSLEE